MYSPVLCIEGAGEAALLGAGGDSVKALFIVTMSVSFSHAVSNGLSL